MNLDNIPKELKALRQWVVWRDDKHPRNAITLKAASVSDPSTWCSFEEARAAVVAGKAIGPGFVFTEEDEYVAIDLDKVINEGQIDVDSQNIIDKLDSYTEVSKSGKGIHIIVRGTKPGTRCRKGNVEIYDKNRYFAITGDLWQDRSKIESRSKKLEWLCSDVFGKSSSSDKPVNVRIELEAEARPPTDRFMSLYNGNEEFKTVWDYMDSSLHSMSDYDWKLATIAIEEGWPDQDIANMIITFRRKYGSKDDLQKALRPDYIPRTISKIRDKSEDEGYLQKLPFVIRRVTQLGEQDAIFTIYLTDEHGEDKTVQIGEVDILLNARRIRGRLYEASVFLDTSIMKKWDKIIKEIMDMIEKIPMETQEELTAAWIEEYTKRRSTLPYIKEKSDFDEIFGAGKNSMAQDDKGRLYLHISAATRYVKVHTATPGMSVKTVARDLVRLGFSKRKFSVVDSGKKRQISLWVSPIGYIDPKGGE